DSPGRRRRTTNNGRVQHESADAGLDGTDSSPRPRTNVRRSSIMISDHGLPSERSSAVSHQPTPLPPQERHLQADTIAQFTLDYLDVLNGSHDALPPLDDLSRDQRALVLNAWSAVDHILASDPLPELDGDPTAVALGAVPIAVLDPVAVRQAR